MVAAETAARGSTAGVRGEVELPALELWRPARSRWATEEERAGTVGWGICVCWGVGGSARRTAAREPEAVGRGNPSHAPVTPKIMAGWRARKNFGRGGGDAGGGGGGAGQMGVKEG